MSSPAVVPEQKAKVNILEKAICVSITRRWLGTSKTISSTVVGAKTDTKMIHVQKDLFDSKELKQLFSFDSKIDAYLDARCLPFPLKRSIYLVPIDLFDDVENALTEHAQGRKAYIDEFVKVYDAAVISAKERLGELFDPSDYPSIDYVKSAFQFEWQYLQFGVAELLKEVRKDVLEREQQKMEARINEASDAIKSLLRQNMADLVSHMVDRLAPGEEGKKKVFRNSMLDNVTEFLNTFKARNLTEDTELQALVDKAKQLTDGVSPDNLRSNEALRSSLQSGFAEIKKSLDKMVTEAPVRSIRFED